MTALGYRINARDPGSRRLHVTLNLDENALAEWSVDGAFELFLPTWTPGSYLIREYARHTSGMFATRSNGDTWSLEHTAKNRIRIPVPESGGLSVCYTVYAHELTVRTCDATSDHVYWNGACVFWWPTACRDAHTTIETLLPIGWEVATALTQSALPRIEDSVAHHEHSASGLDELVDAPFLAGELETISFQVQGVQHQFVSDGLAGLEIPERFQADVVAIIEAAAAVFADGLPYPRYLFLALFADQGYGGLEHRDSTTLLSPRTTFQPGKPYGDFLGLVAHEFFHVWNVRRMRPEGLWSIDYENENYTRLLWVAEGFTAYYDDLICRRAGVFTPKEYLDRLSTNLRNLDANPGRHVQSLAESSFDAWIRLYRPDEHTKNVTQNYYGNGAVVALWLDWTIRVQTDGTRSLDDVMRGLWHRTYKQDRGYTEADLHACIEAILPDSPAVIQELSALVHGPLDPEFDTLASQLGLELKTPKAKQPPTLV